MRLPNPGKRWRGATTISLQDGGVRRAVVGTTVATVLGSATGALLPFVISYSHSSSATDPYFLTAGSILFVTTVVTSVVKGTIVPFAVSWRTEGVASAWRADRSVA